MRVKFIKDYACHLAGSVMDVDNSLAHELVNREEAAEFTEDPIAYILAEPATAVEAVIEEDGATQNEDATLADDSSEAEPATAVEANTVSVAKKKKVKK
jgi:hypothetical protein